MRPKPKVLLVDDRADNLLALQVQLRSQEAEVLSAQSADEALELLLSHEIALALVDVQMPEMDGFQLAELMRGSERTREIPIIFVTAGLHDRSRVFEGYEAGAVDFLVKPLEPLVLNSKVGVFLQLHRQKQLLAERVEQLELAESALRESAEQSRRQLEEIQSIYDSAPIGLCVLDRDLRFLRINHHLAEINGIPASEHLGKTIEEVVPSLAGPAREIAENIFRTGTGVVDLEFTGTTRSLPGVGRTWIEQWLPLKSPEGVVTGINVVAEDITERKRAEALLRSSEQFNRSLIENSRDRIETLDLDGNLRSINGAGHHPLEAPGSSEGAYGSWVEQWRDEDRPQAREALATAASGGTGRFQALETSADGSPHWWDVQVTPIPSSSGQVERLLAASRDITELKHAEELLKRNEARLALLSQTAGRLLASKDPQTIVEALCREVMQLLDCQVAFSFLEDPVTGRLRLNACAGIPEEDLRRIEWLDHESAICGCVAQDEDGQRVVAEDVLHSADCHADLMRTCGVQAYCGHPLLGPAGEILGTLAFGTRTRAQFDEQEIELMRIVADQVATAFQQLEGRKAISAKNEQLIAADRRKNEFMATLSHELRNPLAPIKNSLYILDRAAPGGDQARRAKQIIDRQVNQLARLVDDLLDVTRITCNKVQLQRQRLELNELLCRAVEDHRSEFESTGVHLEHEPGPDQIWVEADWNRLAQAVGNLLQNAVKFTPRGGRVTLSLVADPIHGQAVIRIADTGVGMTERMLACLFQPFMQAETSLARSKGGLGLGLPLVKGLVELHGGTVEATSEGLGRGTEFLLRLPLKPATVPPPSVDERGTRVNSQRVLVIEDNRDAAESLREVLEFEGHDIAVAYDGAEGLAKAREHQPTVILCDIGLPGMDGYQVARALRGAPAFRDVHLVALSGYARPEDLARAREAGFDQHMAKPPSLSQLQQLFAALPACREAPLHAAELARDVARSSADPTGA